jgi:hypothetical protein
MGKTYTVILNDDLDEVFGGFKSITAARCFARHGSEDYEITEGDEYGRTVERSAIHSDDDRVLQGMGLANASEAP